jgi:hypothetical protein
MKALAYAVPLAAGAVGVYVIDKQAEIRFSPTVENHIPPSEAAQIHESISTLAQAVISQGSDNRTALEVIDESNQSIQALEAQLSDIKLLLVNQPSEQEKKIRLTFDQDFKPRGRTGLPSSPPSRSILEMLRNFISSRRTNSTGLECAPGTIHRYRLDTADSTAHGSSSEQYA